MTLATNTQVSLYLLTAMWQLLNASDFYQLEVDGKRNSDKPQKSRVKINKKISNKRYLGRKIKKGTLKQLQQQSQPEPLKLKRRIKQKIKERK